MDCMEFMAGLPDKFFDLVIADPPYGIGEDGGKSNSRRVSNNSWRTPKPSKYKNGGWDKKSPDMVFFDSIKRISKNQIIWGANHMSVSIASNSPSWVVWDKKDGKDDSDFSDCELAYTSFSGGVRMFRMHWVGWGAINSKEVRLHPTQKPVALYKWLLTNYAKPGQKIFDPMMGSQSSRIAAWDMGFDYWGCELDADYYRDGEARFAAHKAKPVLFAPEQMYNFSEQQTLFQ